MKTLLKIAALWAVATLAQAQSAPSGAAAAPEERRWRLGAALGYGERSNPLIQSDDIPVVVDLDIAYFGNRWFFDNGDLGLELLDNSWVTTNLVARVNSDRAFFGKTNTKYVTYSLTSGGISTSLTDPNTGLPLTEVQALPLKPPERSYAIEAGLEAVVGGEWGQATLLAFHDVSREGFMLKADVGEGAWVVARHVHILVQFLHPVAVIARVADNHRAAITGHAEQCDQTSAAAWTEYAKKVVVTNDDLHLGVAVDVH